MNITVDKQEDLTANINIEIPSDKVNSERCEIVKAFSSQADIKGFRKGKAPAKVIEKRFASDIKAELEQRLIIAGVTEAIKQEDLKVLDVAVQKAPEYSDDNKLTVEALAILAPEITLSEYKGVEVEVASDDVTEADITASIDELRNRFSKYNDTEAALEDDQFAIIDFTSNIDGKPVEDVIGKSAGFVGGREGHWVKIQEDAFMPGFSEGLKGMKKDEQKVITVTVQDEFPIAELSGKEVNFDVTVKETKVQELPELNDEFVGTFLPDQTVDDLKELIKTNLEQEKKRANDEEKKEQILQKLHDNTEVDLPERVLNAEIQNNLQQLIKRSVDQGLTEEQINEQKDEVEASSKERAEKSLKSNFILQEIASVEKITVEDTELLTRIQQIAQGENKPAEKVLKELQKNNQIDNLRNSVLLTKTIDFLAENAKVSIKSEDDSETTE